MKLIEADKVKQVIKDYWKTQVNKALALTADVNEANKRINSYLEHNHELLKAIDELPPTEPKAISEWKKEFREYVDSLDITRDDWKGIIEYIDELPSIHPDTTTHDSIPAKNGRNDKDRTTDDLISRQQAIGEAERWLYDGDDKRTIGEMLRDLPSVQLERKMGRWIPDNTDYYRTKFICSVCGESEEVPTMGFGYAPMWGYCPNCGADMRGEKNG